MGKGRFSLIIIAIHAIFERDDQLFSACALFKIESMKEVKSKVEIFKAKYNGLLLDTIAIKYLNE